MLRIDAVDDRCAVREAVIEPTDDRNRYALGGVPVMEAEPEDHAVTIRTSIGEIDWHVLAGRPYQGPVVAFDGGFAALIGEEGDVPWVMTSTDGTTVETTGSASNGPFRDGGGRADDDHPRTISDRAPSPANPARSRLYSTSLID